MQENYREFPSFITAENMQTVTSDTDTKLYEIRRQITKSFTDVSTGRIHNNFIHFDIRNRLNYNQIKILNDELTERGFRVEYTVLDKKGGQIYCKFVDIDGYGDMPVHMIIHWK